MLDIPNTVAVSQVRCLSWKLSVCVSRL